MTVSISRRGLLLGLLAAPAIVRASSLMRVVPWEELDPLNKLRVTGWGPFYNVGWWQGAEILNRDFLTRIESSPDFSHAF